MGVHVSRELRIADAELAGVLFVYGDHFPPPVEIGANGFGARQKCRHGAAFWASFSSGGRHERSGCRAFDLHEIEPGATIPYNGYIYII